MQESKKGKWNLCKTMDLVTDISASYFLLNCLISTKLLDLTNMSVNIENENKNNPNYLLSALKFVSAKNWIGKLDIFSLIGILALCMILGILILVVYLANMRVIKLEFFDKAHRIIMGKRQLSISKFVIENLSIISFFLLVNLLSCNTMDSTETIISNISTQMSQQSILETTNIGTQIIVIENRATSLSDKITCRSDIHYIALFILLVSNTLNVAALFLASKFNSITFSNRWLSIPNRASNGLTKAVYFGIITMNNIILGNFDGINDSLIVILSFEVACLVGAYILNQYARPNYSKEISLQLQRNLLLITFLFCYFLTNLFTHKILMIDKHNYEIIPFLLIGTVTLKIHRNIIVYNKEAAIRMIYSLPNKLGLHDVLVLYFESLEYFQQYRYFKSHKKSMDRIDIEKLHLFWIQVFRIVYKRNPEKLVDFLDEKIQSNYFLVNSNDEYFLKSIVGLIDTIMVAHIRDNPEDKIVALLYLNFLLDVKGGFSKAFAILFAKEGERGADHLTTWERNLMIEKLKDLLNRHLVTCRFSKLYEVNMISEHEQADDTNYYAVIKFIDLFEMTKKDMLNSMNYLIKILQEVNHKADVSKIHSQIQTCFDLKKKTEKGLLTLFGAVEDRFSPLLYTLVFYYKSIDQNTKEMRKYSKMLINNYDNVNMNLFAKFGRLTELLVVIISGEGKDFHKIIDLYGKFELVNQKKSELLGYDLTRILPNVVRPIHRTFILKPNNYDSLLEDENDIVVYAMGLDGFVTRVDAKVRITFTYEHGIRFLCYVFAPKTIIPNEMIAVVAPNGTATDVTRETSKFISPGQNVSVMNAALGEDILNISKVISSFRESKYEDILADRDLREAWDNYIALTKGREYSLLQTMGNIKFETTMKVFVEEIIYKRINHLWIMKICKPDSMPQDTYRSPFNPAFVNGEKLEKIKYFINCFKEERGTTNYVTGMIEGSNIESFNSEIREFNSRSINKLPAQKNSLVASHRLIQAISQEGKMKELITPSDELAKNKLSMKTGLVPTLADIILNVIEKKREDSNEFGDSKEMSIKGSFLKDNRKSFHGSVLFAGSESNISQSRVREVGDLRLVLRRKNKTVGKTLLSITLITLVSILLYLEQMRNTTFMDANGEVRGKSKTLSLFSREIVSQSFVVFNLELCRLTKSGLITENALKSVSGTKTTYEQCEEVLNEYGSQQLQIDLFINNQIENLKFPSLFQIEKWRGTTINFTSYYTAKNGEIEWENSIRTRTSGLAAISGYAEYFNYRDYKLDNNIPNFAIETADREQDLPEEMYRKNLQNSLNKQYSARSDEFDLYLKNVVHYNILMLQIELYSVVILSLMFISALLLLFLLEIYKVRYFYDLLYQFKRTDVEKQINDLKSIYLALESSIEFGDEKLLIDIESNNENNHRIESVNKERSKNKIDGRVTKKKGMIVSMNIKLNHGRFTFGFSQILSNTIVCIFLLIFLEYIIYIVYSAGSRRISDLTKLYVATIQTWTGLYSLHNAAFQTLIWNNTSPIWDQPSLETYTILKDKISNELIPVYTEALSFDLGDFTSTYKQRVMIDKACGNLVLVKIAELCPETYGGILNSNLISVMKEMIITLNNLLEKWKYSREDWKEVLKIIDTKLVYSIWAHFGTIAQDIQDTLVAQIYKKIMSEVEFNINLVNSIEIYEYSLIAIWTLWLSVMLWKGMNIQNSTKMKAINVTQHSLWKNNFKLNKYLFG